MSGGFLDGVWKVSGGCVKGTWKVLGRFGRYPKDFWRVFGICQEGDWKESGQCLKIIWKVSGKFYNHSVSWGIFSLSGSVLITSFFVKLHINLLIVTQLVLNGVGFLPNFFMFL